MLLRQCFTKQLVCSFNGDGIKGEAGNDGNMADGNTTTNDQEVSGGVEGFGQGSGGN